MMPRANEFTDEICKRRDRLRIGYHESQIRGYLHYRFAGRSELGDLAPTAMENYARQTGNQADSDGMV